MLSCRPPSPPRRRGAVVHRPAQEDEANPPPAPRTGPCPPPSRLRQCPGVGRPLARRAAGAPPRAEAVPAGSCVGVGASGGSRACECSPSVPGLGLAAARAGSPARKAPAGRRPQTPASAAHALGAVAGLERAKRGCVDSRRRRAAWWRAASAEAGAGQCRDALAGQARVPLLGPRLGRVAWTRVKASRPRQRESETREQTREHGAKRLARAASGCGALESETRQTRETRIRQRPRRPRATWLRCRRAPAPP